MGKLAREVGDWCRGGEIEPAMPPLRPLPAPLQETPSSELKPRETIYFPSPTTPRSQERRANVKGEDDARGDDDVEDIAKMATVWRAAKGDPATRTLFIHGLGWSIEVDDLHSVFFCFGFVIFRSHRSTFHALYRPHDKKGKGERSRERSPLPVPFRSASLLRPLHPTSRTTPSATHMPEK